MAQLFPGFLPNISLQDEQKKVSQITEFELYATLTIEINLISIFQKTDEIFYIPAAIQKSLRKLHRVQTRGKIT